MMKRTAKIAALPLLLGAVALACPRAGVAPAGSGGVRCGPVDGPGTSEWLTGSLKGTIRAEGGRPLSGARVMVEGTGCAAISGEDGSFHIPRVPVGRQTLVAEIIGYETLRQPGVDISKDVTTEVELVMSGGRFR